MIFDVRLPIGLLFLAIGLLVTGVGLTGDPEVFEAHSAGLNIDVVWGLVMTGFGALMLLLAFVHRKHTPPSANEG